MKAILSLALVACIAQFVFSQGIPVSTAPEKKNVVLEEFTGFRCQYCPDGHKRARAFAAAHPGDVVLVNIHAGVFANPGPGDPDFVTNYGTTLDNHFNDGAYPAATINRHYFPQWSTSSSVLAMGRGYWASAGDQILQEDADANLGVKAEINVQTRELKVIVQIYYTANSNTSTNKLTVYLLQNNIVGPQVIGPSVTPDPALVLPGNLYLHSHMLRHALTNAWGETIANTTQGSYYNDTLTYTLPEDIDGIPLELGDLEVAAFVAEGMEEIITGQVIQPTYHFSNSYDVLVKDVISIDDPFCGFTASPVVQVQNYGNEVLRSLYVDYSVNGSPTKSYKWEGTLDPLSQVDISLDAINFFPQATNTLTLETRDPNNNQDQNTSNNSITTTFAQAEEGVSNTVYMTLQLEHWGSEVTWEFVNGSGQVLKQGGPYTDVPQNNPLPAPILDTFQLNDDECYALVTHDDYGDGILGTNTGFTLVDDNGLVILQNFADYDGGGKFSFGSDVQGPDSSVVYSSVSVLPDLINEIKISPNPTSGIMYLNINLTEATDLNISLVNILGQEVIPPYKASAVSGNQTVKLNVQDAQSGIYFLNVETNGERISKRVLISR